MTDPDPLPKMISDIETHFLNVLRYAATASAF